MINILNSMKWQNSADLDGATECYDGQIANDCHSCLLYEQSDVGDLRQSRE